MKKPWRWLTDAFGRRIEPDRLTDEVAGPTLTGVRSPLTGYPGDGLTPDRLATILREADAGDPLRYLELAETVEERDAHYLGVLSTRKRQVSQLDVTVEAASDDAADIARADLVRDWLGRDELAEELFDMLDAVGKGYSLTEIVWDVSAGQWRPARLIRRDPRSFRPARADLATPMLIGEHGAETALPGGKFVTLVMRAKSGLPVRSGIARVAAWCWLFKAMTQRDWAIFTQTYGQPVRLGKYGPGATEADRDTLYRAVANIAGDMAAIIPESMQIEFVEAANLGTGHSNYRDRCDWLDQQVSKLVLGQTTTTDAISGGHAVAREHRLVQEDIERADAKMLSAALNRDLVRVWMDLEFGPGGPYPRVRIARPEAEDIAALTKNVARLVPLGLRVGMSTMRDRLGLPDPGPDEEVLAAPAAPAAPAAAPALQAALQAERQPAGQPAGQPEDQPEGQPEDQGRTADEIIAGAARPPIGELVGRVRRIIAGAGSLEEAAAALENAMGAAPAELSADLAQALLLAWLAGSLEEVP